eukprot:GHVO01044826.1.p1 GENE.GHVO01044826.1~~GHVO01044826.1.p1  ORF type:complete len:117 (+),score=8.91 GHVO01044826.1:150-500(+)
MDHKTVVKIRGKVGDGNELLKEVAMEGARFLIHTDPAAVDKAVKAVKRQKLCVEIIREVWESVAPENTSDRIATVEVHSHEELVVALFLFPGIPHLDTHKMHTLPTYIHACAVCHL